MSPKHLIDNSAFSRLWDVRLARSTAEEVASAITAGELASCLPFVLEAGYSARSASDHAELTERLLKLPFFSIDGSIERRALRAQAQLARAGHHRMPPVDLLIAALADGHGLGVLHYDADYDRIRELTDLRFESRWLAPRGSL